MKAAIVVLLTTAVLYAADLSGTWALEFEQDRDGVLYKADCSFKQEGDRLTGSCLSGFESIVPVRGNVQGSVVTFRFSTGLEQGTVATFFGRLNDRETDMTGTWTFDDQRGNKGEGTFTAAKRQ
jgi:hypothetical protein